jgi:primosomal protein N'
MFPVVFRSCTPTVESLKNVLCGRIDVVEMNEFSNVSAASESTDGRYTELSLMNK